LAGALAPELPLTYLAALRIAIRPGTGPAQSLTLQKPMILPRFRRNPDQRSIAALYGAIVAQARHPAFYGAYGVPDTVLGRFDMVVLHAVLLVRRLRGSQAVHALGQGVFEAFCRDMDDNLREMGVSDVGVPREMRKLAEAFYGRARAYEAALGEESDEALVAALTRNVYADTVAPVAAAALAAYVRAAARTLTGADDAALAHGEACLPNPEDFAAPAVRAAE
jgi:cytochrome b pre-mRNA-processing protein 3